MSTDDAPSPSVVSTRLQQAVIEIIRVTGLNTAHAYPTVEDGKVTKVVIRYRGDTTFEILDKLANAFGSTRIDLGFEIGPPPGEPPSDPSVSPYLVIHDPVLPAQATEPRRPV